MNILLIPENFPTDENPVAGIFMKDYITAMQAFAKVTVFNSNPWYRGQYEEVEGARCFDLHLFAKKWRFPFNIAAYTYWERQSLKFTKKLPKPDLIHLHGTAQRGKWVAKLAAHWNVPFVITEHTGPWSAISARPAILKRVKGIMEKADLVMPVSKHLEKEILESGIKPQRMAVLGNPIDTDFFSLREKPLTATKHILFLGRLDPFKGGLRTLKAYNKIKDEFPEYRLTIAGDGVEGDAIQTFIEENHLEAGVEFLRKQLNREEMRTLFHESTFLVFPSEFESFGLVAAEAMATGLPVVISDRTGPLDYSSSTNSIQIEPESIEAGLREMIERIEGFDPKKVRSSIENNFGTAAFSNKLKEAYLQTPRSS
ncbi:glycosyltransferase family 4 protein [Cryomorphaceae bacterium 1068]|nr:glycosyltransferase family 4 protein [Cryomorphaceae bacterium 1068]